MAGFGGWRGWLPALALCVLAGVAWGQGDEVTPEVQQLYAEAKAAQAAGNTAGAIAKYRAMLRLAPGLAPAYNNLGMLYFNEHEYGRAAETLSRGLRLDPSMTTAEGMLGMSLLETGEAGKAEAPLEAASGAKPEDAQLQMALARDLLQLGRDAQAAGVLERYTAGHPKDQQAWYLLGKTYLRLSEGALGKVNAIDPNSAYAHLVAGEIDASMSNYDGAEVEYGKAIAAAPQQPGVHMHMGDALWSQGKWDAAEQEYRAELGNAPRNCEARWKLGNSMLQANESAAEALGELNQAVEGCPELVQARVDRARALVKLKRGAEALPDLLKAEKSDPEEPSIHFLLAQVYRGEGKTAETRAQMEEYSRLLKQASAAVAKQAGETMQLDGKAH